MKRIHSQSGFTLVELMGALSIFIIVLTISMGSLVTIFSGNRKVRTMKALVNNLQVVVESIGKEARYGKSYHCGSSGSLISPQDCPSGANMLVFTPPSTLSIATQVRYRLNGTAVEKMLVLPSGGGTYVPITGSDVVIDSLIFYVTGSTVGDTQAPAILVKITGHAGTGGNRSDYTIQSYIAQRTLDV